MRRFAFLLVLILTVLMLTALAAPAFAQSEYPNVANVTAFSAEANFMSLPGWLRLLVFRDQGIWLTHPEAARIVAAQKAG